MLRSYVEKGNHAVAAFIGILKKERGCDVKHQGENVPRYGIGACFDAACDVWIDRNAIALKQIPY